MRLIDADALLAEYGIDTGVCATCKHKWSCNSNDSRTTFNRNDICVSISDAQTVTGWISVEDRLPEKKGDYIAYTKDGIVWPYWFDDIWFDSLGYETGTVTHWMPLPEPPEEVEHG